MLQGCVILLKPAVLQELCGRGGNNGYLNHTLIVASGLKICGDILKSMAWNTPVQLIFLINSLIVILYT